MAPNRSSGGYIDVGYWEKPDRARAGLQRLLMTAQRLVRSTGLRVRLARSEFEDPLLARPCRSVREIAQRGFAGRGGSARLLSELAAACGGWISAAYLSGTLPFGAARFIAASPSFYVVRIAFEGPGAIEELVLFAVGL